MGRNKIKKFMYLYWRAIHLGITTSKSILSLAIAACYWRKRETCSSNFCERKREKKKRGEEKKILFYCQLESSIDRYTFQLIYIYIVGVHTQKKKNLFSFRVHYLVAELFLIPNVLGIVFFFLCVCKDLRERKKKDLK